MRAINLIPPFILLSAVGRLPDPTLLNLTTINPVTPIDPVIPINPTVDPKHTQALPSSFKEPQSITISEGLPSIPGKLTKRIQLGQFIKQAELLPDQLGTITALPDEDGSI